MTVTEVRSKVTSDDRYAIAALIRVYQGQTESEAISRTTQELNMIGFNGVDAGLLTSFAEQYLEKGTLTHKQMVLLKSKIGKYSRQLIGIEPMDVNVVNVPGVPKAHQEKPKANNIVSLEGNVLKISFEFTYETKDKVSSLPDRRYNPIGKYWTAPLDVDNINKLSSWGFELTPEVKTWKDKMESKGPQEKEVSHIPGLKRELFPFQKKGVSFIESRDGNALLADEMGLGKTAQALAYLQLHPKKRPVIIVCPATLKYNWQNEINIWTTANNKVEILSGTSPYKLSKADIFIINYDVLKSWVDTLKKVNPQVVILDEAHYIKNPKAARTKAIKSLCKKIPHKIIITGTPIVNRPIEAYTMINLVDETLFPKFTKYAFRYCAAKHNGFGWDFTGASNTMELHNKLTKTIMIRRLKTDVLKDLPDKMRIVVPVDIDNMRDYKLASGELNDWLDDLDFEENVPKNKKNTGAEALARIEHLKQLSIEGKINQCISWIEDYLEQNDKIVVFTTHIKTVDILMNHFGSKAVRVDGSVVGEKRQKAVDEFQNNDNVKVFVGNLKAAGVGITLTKANATCFLELGWTPGDHDQAEDRVHRIGQEADCVTAYYLVAKDTIEEEICQLLDKKRAVLASVLDGKEAVEDEALLWELLRVLKEGK